MTENERLQQWSAIKSLIKYGIHKGISFNSGRKKPTLF